MSTTPIHGGHERPVRDRLDEVAISSRWRSASRTCACVGLARIRALRLLVLAEQSIRAA
ncbi:MAG: hypothetical protein U5K43_15495 [Halofilum sp. (in: g-proteobacteria)]|nr:hypothetical protein [Halofilum sp. (in: g-proteobacteria)]